MTRKRNPDRIMPRGRETGRVVCADGYPRVRYQANQEQVCSRCSTLIRCGDTYTIRKITTTCPAPSEGTSPRKKRRRVPRPVCQACQPFTEIEEEA